MRNKSGAAYAATKYMEFYVKEPATLMDFLMKEMSGISRNKVKAILAGHGVSVNRKMTTLYNYELKPGMVVRVSRHKRSTELNSKFVKIVYEDKDLIVIEKSIGILSMASAANQFCVKTILDEYFKKRHFKCTAHVVHRLDRDTSGLMIYAKNIEIQQILEEHWHSIVSDRRYIAVLCGKMEQEGGTVTSWLKANDDFSLVELKLETGRKNQIRVHMSDLGHPVAGDVKYGNGRNPIGRLALHAYRLNFTHPRTGEFMDFETPFPTAFMNLFSEKK